MTEDVYEKARAAIACEDYVAFEVAEERGQIFDNVSHMTWFLQAVAEKIKEQDRC